MAYIIGIPLALTALIAGEAEAHELRPIIATLDFAGADRAELTLSLNLEAAMAGIGPGHQDTADAPTAPDYDRLRQLGPDALKSEFQDFAPSLIEGIGLRLGDQLAALSLKGAAIPEIGDTALARISELVLTAPLPAGVETIDWQLDPLLGDSVIRLRSVTGEVARAQFVAAGEAVTGLTLDGARPQPWTEVFADYLRVGFVHIVPKGLDHILFVVGLFLLSTRLRALLWQISAFTIAHTVTLALGATGWVSISPAIVEPLIALSIAWVAIENLLTDRLHSWRPVVVFCFGLLHGLGFAGVLGEIGLAPGRFVTGLLAFNIGVELGQLAVIAACFAAVGWAMGRPWYRRAVVIPGSLAIAVTALWWVAERTGLV